MTFDPTGFLYDTDDEKKLFGDNFCCTVERFEHCETTLVAQYPLRGQEGRKVNVYCAAMPARLFTVRVPDDNDFEGNLRQGFALSVSGELVRDIAKAISEEMLEIKR